MNAIVQPPELARPVARQLLPQAAVAVQPSRPPALPAIVDERMVRRRSIAAQRINLPVDMAGGIAHDFRNVLAVISSAVGFAEPHIGSVLTMLGGRLSLFGEPAKGMAFDLFFPVDEEMAIDRDRAGQLNRWAKEGGSAGAARLRP